MNGTLKTFDSDTRTGAVALAAKSCLNDLPVMTCAGLARR
jgi:hypothetical protein